MTAPCARRNALVRSGLTQDGRRRAELAPDHFLPDERDLADLILFGQRFARYIRYYGASNTADGDWAAFFESDVSAGLAALAKLPVDAFRGFQRDLETWLRADPTRNPAELSAHAKLVFHLPVALLQTTGVHQARLPADHPFVATVVALAARDLAEPLGGLISWYKGATVVPGAGNGLFDDTPLVIADYNVGGGPGDDRVRLSSTIAGAIAGQPALSAVPVPDLILRDVPPGTWAGLYAGAAADTSPYEDAIGAPRQRYQQIYDALSYNLLSAAIERIYQGLERIRREASVHLQASLESFAGHPPHYGLWLAFLELFQHARGKLNEFTGRHLDFYFREVLRLGNRAATPDKVHLLFELAKGTDAHLLPAGTMFRAGKDKLGKAVSYALENDIVVNRASVAELRGLQVTTGGRLAAKTQLPLAAAVVRSRDGLGKVELPRDDPAWPAFGPATSPAARVGFAIGDRKLFLREGTRTIDIRVELARPVGDPSVSPRWSVRLTGDKGWFEVDSTRVTTTVDNSYVEPPGEKHSAAGTGKRKGLFAPWRNAGDKSEAASLRHVLVVSVTLNADDPPIVPSDPKLHGTDHEAGIPVIELAFDFSDPESARAFAVLRDVKALRVTLLTTAAGLKNLMVVAGGSTVEVAKPFTPFGAQPKAGADFIIGSSELFSKSIAGWRLTMDWETAYTTGNFFLQLPPKRYVAAEAVLSGGGWHSLGKGAEGIGLGLANGHVTVEMRSAALIDGLARQTMENPPLTASSLNGFVRLRLPAGADFGHATYVTERTGALIAQSAGQKYARSNKSIYTMVLGSGQTVPREPYTPVITRLEAGYETTRDTAEHFRLLHPFGVAGDSDSAGRLFPPFRFEGALLVGVKDLKPPVRLTLLVQVADGSGDPLKHAPRLQFSYLSGDDWKAFDQRDVSDRTRDFSGSGVLALNLPEEADTAHRILPPGLHWISIAAPRDADALNRLLSVDAQAARASFVDSGNDPAFLETPLPGGAISKLVTPDPVIKKIVQPWSSFDGRPVETSPAFAIRVSERLRHKDRAVAMFDYEALILEAFPRLYRVKCLNTTELRRDAQNRIVADNELMPGAVTVVTVPWTHGQNSRDPLRPYTDQATLTAVDSFLRKRISPFVRLEVQNPKFEEVQVDFLVRFRPDIGDIQFYINELNRAIVGFLTPWSQPGGGEIIFGGRLWKSSLIDFIEEQPEVDYITDVRLYHKVDIGAPAGGWSPVDVEMIEATTARSILVSAAKHTIVEVPGNA